MSSTIRCACFLIVVLGLANGCAAPPIDAMESGFLDSYSVLSPGKHLDMVWIDPLLREDDDYESIRVEPIDVNRLKSVAKMTPEDCRGWLTESLEKACTAHPGLLALTGKRFEIPTQLELAITQVIPGDAIGRFFGGGFGAGNATLQVEGKVVDSRSGQVLFLFADRRQTVGDSNFANVGQDMSESHVQWLLDEFAMDLIKELKGQI